jgi:hypothetical protein
MQLKGSQRENSTTQFEFLLANSTYNDITGAPNPELMKKTELVKRDVESCL